MQKNSKKIMEKLVALKGQPKEKPLAKNKKPGVSKNKQEIFDKINHDLQQDLMDATKKHFQNEPQATLLFFMGSSVGTIFAMLKSIQFHAGIKMVPCIELNNEIRKYSAAWDSIKDDLGKVDTDELHKRFSEVYKDLHFKEDFKELEKKIMEQRNGI